MFLPHPLAWFVAALLLLAVVLLLVGLAIFSFASWGKRRSLSIGLLFLTTTLASVLAYSWISLGKEDDRELVLRLDARPDEIRSIGFSCEVLDFCFDSRRRYNLRIELPEGGDIAMPTDGLMLRADPTGIREMTFSRRGDFNATEVKGLLSATLQSLSDLVGVRPNDDHLKRIDAWLESQDRKPALNLGDGVAGPSTCLANSRTEVCMALRATSGHRYIMVFELSRKTP